MSIPVGSNRTVTGAIYTTRLPESKIPVYLIENDGYYDREELYTDPSTGSDYVDNCERFSFFCRAVLEATRSMGTRPDVIHCNDWQSAMIPAYLRNLYKPDDFFRGVLTVQTIHNLGYQGVFPKEDFQATGLDGSHFNDKELEHYGKINLLKGGIVFSDIITTVSKKYGEEIQTEEYGAGLNGVLKERRMDLYGIINGIDYSVWNPEVDGLIPEKYGPDNLRGKSKCKEHLQKRLGLAEKKDVPVIGMITRLVAQKGIDLVLECWDELMELDVELVLLGTGEKKYEDGLRAKAEKHPGKASVYVGFDNQLSHEIEAGADMFLMPSRYEPCGLNQMYSLKYGTVPVVRKTGGLADTINPSVGFVFESYTSKEMLRSVKEAVEAYADGAKWTGLMRTGMLQDWSWDKSARLYSDLYKGALKEKRR